MNQHVMCALAVGLCLVPLSSAEKLRETTAIAFPDGGIGEVHLEGTYRVPDADGIAKVKRNSGVVKIRLQIDDLLPATLFGGDYTTYVVWAVSKTGQTDNLGELTLDGDRAEMDVATEFDAFGLLVTAEPHFLVHAPSRFVVLELRKAQSKVQYAGFTGIYNFNRQTLAGLKEAKEDVDNGLQQAVTALRLAQRAGARQFALREFDEAQQALDSLLANSDGDSTKLKSGDAEVRNAVRLAVEAETRAHARALAGIPGSGFDCCRSIN